jgi:PhnB protein
VTESRAPRARTEPPNGQREEINVAEVIPHIVVRDAGRAAEWYERALGAQISSRIPVPDGRFMQIELFFGDSRVMIADELPELGAVSTARRDATARG